jgi:hypothetical protein
MKVERLVSVHLDEFNLGREVGATRHATRSQPPELILTSVSNTPAGVAYLEALANSLPRATREEVVKATEVAQATHGQSTVDTHNQHRFTQVKVPSIVLPPDELKKRALASLADVLRAGRFAGGAEVKVVQAGTTIEVRFPRTASSLWITTSFSESKHIKEVANFCMGVRTDPILREGWSALYNFDSKTGNLHIRAAEAGLDAPAGWKLIPR